MKPDFPDKTIEGHINVEQEDKTERLQKVMSKMGVASRRASEEMITAGRVAVNDKIVDTLGTKVDISKDKITIDGQVVSVQPRFRYILLYKPAGYITSAKDQKGRRTVLDLLNGVTERVYPVGRLDYATGGLLLLTNDGELTNALLHPSKEVEKTYQAEAEGRVSAANIRILREGVQLTDGITAPAKVNILEQKEKSTVLEITIHEGKNRQIRRMLDAIGHPVIRLKRVRFAFLDLKGLKLGEFRDLTKAEVGKLQSLATTKSPQSPSKSTTCKIPREGK